MKFDKDKFKSIIVDDLGVRPEEITPKASFVDDLGADSLGLLEIVMSIEEEFGIEISDSDAKKIKTVGDAMKYLKKYKK